jgi:hypothetical protein
MIGTSLPIPAGTLALANCYEVFQYLIDNMAFEVCVNNLMVEEKGRKT